MKNQKSRIKTLFVATAIGSMQISCASSSAAPTSIALAALNQVGNANWNTTGSVVQASKGNGFLVTKTANDNFHLRVEFQAAAGTNSGVFVRCENPAVIDDKSCYEINIFDTRPDQTYRTGAITGHVAPKIILGSEDGKWHTFEIRAVGPTIRVLLDGKETAFLRDETRLSGYTALQLAQGEIKFRNLAMIPLRDEPDVSRKSVLDGVWELESIVTVDKAGKATPWCPGSYGVIIYTNNYMSTAVNCTSEPSKSIIYAGPFETRNRTVFHHAQNASVPSMNKVHTRDFKFKDENRLELRGDLGETALVVNWVRR